MEPITTESRELLLRAHEIIVITEYGYMEVATCRRCHGLRVVRVNGLHPGRESMERTDNKGGPRHRTVRHWFWYWPSQCPGGWFPWVWWRVGDGTWRLLGVEHHP